MKLRCFCQYYRTKTALVFGLFIAVCVVWASSERCFATSVDFIESGYLSCASNSGDVSSFFRCISEENLVKGKYSEHAIDAYIKNISYKQKDIIDFLKKEGMLSSNTSYEMGFTKLKTKKYYIGPQLRKNFIFTRETCANIKKDDYLNYLQQLKSIRCNLDRQESSFKLCQTWNDIIEREILVHQQIPIDCYCFVKEHNGDILCNSYLGSPMIEKYWAPIYEHKIMRGADQFREMCNEYSTTSSIATKISSSLEEYYWSSVKHHGLYMSYLKSFSNGKYEHEATEALKTNFVNATTFVKGIETEFENGKSLDKIIIEINGYQNNYPEMSNSFLEDALNKFNHIKDTIAVFLEYLGSDKYQDEDDGAFKCSFVSGNTTYKVEMQNLNKLPQKNGTMSCMYPLYSSDHEIYAVVMRRLSIKNRKISEGRELGINPRSKEVVFKNVISNGNSKGGFMYKDIYNISFDRQGYSIKFSDETDQELTPSEARDIIYLLSKNENEAYYLECIPLVLISDYGVEPTCAENRNENYKAEIRNGRVQSVSIETSDETVFLPLNNWGEIDGVVKYWNSQVGNVEITVNAQMSMGVDKKNKYKVAKVRIKGCTFNPPRKITGYKNTKSGKTPMYEKYSSKCETVASEMGMSLLLHPQTSYRYDENEFIPNFLIRFFDWGDVVDFY